MSSSRHSNTSRNGDWWELTNTGNAAVDLNGLAWDDTRQDAGQLIFPTYMIQPGESVIILNESSFSTFQTAWGLTTATRVFIRTDFTGDANGNFPGLSSGGDGVFLYQGSGVPIDSFTFGTATAGSSFARFSDGAPVPGGVSQDGQFLSYSSSGSPNDIASPGQVAPPPMPLPPTFIDQFEIAWIVDENLMQADYRVTAVDPNAEDTITLTVTEKPDWLTVTDLGGGLAQLSGTPTTAEIGRHSFTMSAMDDSGNTTAATQEFFINVSPPSSPVILNEYNAVAEDVFLGGGLADDPDGDADSQLGRVAGNGGEWIELAVVGDGTAGSTVDLREWTVTIQSETGTTTLKLSDHVAWSAVPAGTLLTLTRRRNQPLGFNVRSLLNTTGYIWSNIWMKDPILINREASTIGADAVSSGDTRVTLLNAADEIVYGPFGESLAGRDDNMNNFADRLISVRNDEVFKLEGNVAPSINPISVLYDDGSSSTFGRPNVWNAGASVQSFAAYLGSNTPPSFLTQPELAAERGSYSQSIAATTGSMISVIEAPSFLSHDTTTNLLSNNRLLTAADAGFYPITVQAVRNGLTTYLTYELEVLDPAPAVILNEANAVGDTNYLNGGTEMFDTDGEPASADLRFQRVLGNGGDWFELVVVGNGGPGTTDIRSWQIEVGRFDRLERFTVEDTITLTDNAAWSGVENGTILTFIDNDTANGGRDSGIKIENRLNVEGWAWTNVYLGDATLVSAADALDLDINGDGTLFRLKNASGGVVFGPVGESRAPDSGISDFEILELEDDPSPMISPLDDRTATEQGYDDGSSSSTFGSPNSFTPRGTIIERLQDFSAFVISDTSPYAGWADSFGIADSSTDDDNDGDGFTNLEEYLFGGSPIDSTSQPIVTLNPETGTTTYDVRVDDSTFAPVGERSTDLQNWVTDELMLTEEASPLGDSYRRRSYSYTGNEPKMFFRVFSE